VTAVRALALAPLAAFVLAACGGDDTTAPATTEAPDAAATGTGDQVETEERSDMELRLAVGETVLRARMLDNATSRDFASLLPLTLTLSDYAQTEKVSDLPRRLSTADAPEGADPEIGDIAYYAPWGNLAIYYRDFGYSSGLVKLGHIDSGVEELAAMRGDFTVTIEMVNPS
jgi:hypothetical protein